MPEERPWTHIAAWLVAGALVLFAAWKLLSPPARGGERVAVSRPSAAEPGGGSGGVFVYVHVAGAVRRPGLYRLRAGSRIAAALERAGGPSGRADLTSVNLAARVQDGQQVVVPREGAQGTAGGTAAGGRASGAQPSLASATVEQLDELDGIGPTLARRIVEYRQAHGGFGSIDELKQVEGIGDKRFQALRKALGP